MPPGADSLVWETGLDLESRPDPQEKLREPIGGWKPSTDRIWRVLAANGRRRDPGGRVGYRCREAPWPVPTDGVGDRIPV